MYDSKPTPRLLKLAKIIGLENVVNGFNQCEEFGNNSAQITWPVPPITTPSLSFIIRFQKMFSSSAQPPLRQCLSLSKQKTFCESTESWVAMKNAKLRLETHQVSLIYLFMSRHEVHSMNTHTAERRLIKTDETERSTRHWSRRNHRVTDTVCNCIEDRTIGLQTHS